MNSSNQREEQGVLERSFRMECSRNRGNKRRLDWGSGCGNWCGSWSFLKWQWETGFGKEGERWIGGAQTQMDYGMTPSRSVCQVETGKEPGSQGAWTPLSSMLLGGCPWPDLGRAVASSLGESGCGKTASLLHPWTGLNGDSFIEVSAGSPNTLLPFPMDWTSWLPVWQSGRA
jgi:hypothetical protein